MVKERPHLRKKIKFLCQKYGCTPRELIEMHNRDEYHLSRGFYLQARKMAIEEKRGKTDGD